MALQVLLVQQDLKVLQAHKAQLVILVLQVLPDLKVQQAHQAQLHLMDGQGTAYAS